jgi:hypothetical protein
MPSSPGTTLSRENEKRVRHVVAAIAEFSRYAQLTQQQAYRYLADHGAIEFLDDHYEAEHLLSFDDVVEDLVQIAAQSGGSIR